MKRQRQWLARWASFLTGICIGLLIVAPVLASTKLPGVSTSDMLQSSQSLLEVAAMLWSALLIRQARSRPQSPSRMRA